MDCLKGVIEHGVISRENLRGFIGKLAQAANQSLSMQVITSVGHTKKLERINFTGDCVHGCGDICEHLVTTFNLLPQKFVLELPSQQMDDVELLGTLGEQLGPRVVQWVIDTLHERGVSDETIKEHSDKHRIMLGIMRYIPVYGGFDGTVTFELTMDVALGV